MLKILNASARTGIQSGRWIESPPWVATPYEHIFPSQGLPLYTYTSTTVVLYMTHCNPTSLFNLNTRVLYTNPLIDKQNN